MPSLASDRQLAKRRDLFRRRLIATGLLLGAAALFIAMQFLPQSFAVRLVGTAAEAALVGGLADWFAVTALFRRPLGLPIPHTALIPKRKNELGRALGDFVRDNFLAPDLVVARLRAENRALQLAHWLQSARAGAFLRERSLALLPMLLERAADADLRRYAGDLAGEALRRTDLAPILDAGIDALLATGKHMALVDAGAELAESSLGALEASVLEKVSEQTGRLFPAWFDRKIAEGMVRGTQKWLAAIRDPDSAERARTDDWIRTRLAELRTAPGYARLLADARALIAANPAMQQMAASALEELRREIAADLQSPEPRIGEAVARVARKSGTLLAASPSMQEAVNGAVERVVVDYIAPWRLSISAFIAEVVESWDTATVVDLVELEVGGDLQYVRINGTVVGALIGIALFLISAAL